MREKELPEPRPRHSQDARVPPAFHAPRDVESGEDSSQLGWGTPPSAHDSGGQKSQLNFKLCKFDLYVSNGKMKSCIAVSGGSGSVQSSDPKTNGALQLMPELFVQFQQKTGTGSERGRERGKRHLTWMLPRVYI